MPEQKLQSGTTGALHHSRRPQLTPASRAKEDMVGGVSTSLGKMALATHTEPHTPVGTAPAQEVDDESSRRRVHRLLLERSQALHRSPQDL